mgnify:CR=1 FL=1
MLVKWAIINNNLGGNEGSTGPKSINTKTKKAWGANFPIITVEDWVKTQKALIQTGNSPWN